MEWRNEHHPDCPVTAGRASLTEALARDPEDAGLRGAVPEWDAGGDEEAEHCAYPCQLSPQLRWPYGRHEPPGEPLAMHTPEPEVPSLVVRVDGDNHAVVPLRDGDDAFNAAAERGALDRAYEAKESCPECAVEIVVLTAAP
jgi:hypothetical protein